MSLQRRQVEQSEHHDDRIIRLITVAQATSRGSRYELLLDIARLIQRTLQRCSFKGALFHTGSALFVEEAACLFNPLRRDVVTRCQYYIFWVGQLLRNRLEGYIWS
ncbi:hypothetical protein MBT84_46320 [Streptomyces sp. MBT84]|nr:hypothetical protein [Streptomyces sp. MBT84]